MDFIGKLENIKEDWKIIQIHTNLPDLSHQNKMGQKINWRDFYTLETAEMVYQYYKKDFELLGYEDEYEKLIEYIKNKKEEKEIKIYEISPLEKYKYEQYYQS